MKKLNLLKFTICFTLLFATVAINAAPSSPDSNKWIKPHTAQPAIFLTTNPNHATGCYFRILGTSYPLRYFNGFGIPPTCGNPNYTTLTLQTSSSYTVDINDGVMGWQRTFYVSTFQSCLKVDLY